MPSSKSLTSSRSDYGRAVAHCVKNEDYEALLLDLLATVHRDGGQYTTLTGLCVSFLDAKAEVEDLYRRNASLEVRLDKALSKRR